MIEPSAVKQGGAAGWLVRGVSRLSDVGAVLSALIFCAMTLMILTEVILRNFFGSSTEVAGEYSGYALAAMIYLGMGFSFREDAHIRIIFLRDKLAPLGAFILEICCTVFVLGLSGMSSAFLWELVITSKKRNLTAYTPAETPLYIPQALVFAGMVLLTVQIFGRLVALIAAGPERPASEHRSGKD